MMTPLGKGGRMYSRSRRWPRAAAVTVIVVLAVVAVVGTWWWFSRDDASAPAGAPSPTPSCVTPTAKPPRDIPPPTEVDVDVANGTDRAGLALSTADDLADRGFVVVGIGNTQRPVDQQVALVRFGKAGRAAAVRLASFVPGADLKLVDSIRSATVQLWLGAGFDGVVASSRADVDAVTLPPPAPICRKG